MIHDNIVLAHEVLHYLCNQKKGRRVDCAVKLNIQKAYARVEWDFLIEDEWFMITLWSLMKSSIICVTGRKEEDYIVR